MPALLFEVDSIRVEILESFPPQLRITAGGKANSGGWTNVHLQPVTEPGDPTTLRLRLVGSAPHGQAMMVMEPHTGSYTYSPAPEGWHTIVVMASNNQLAYQTM